MVKCAIHQPHYFPWLGYLNKMACVDKFIILDEVQIEKGSNMYRNKLCTLNGQEKYITVAYEKKNCLELPFCQIKLDHSTDWQGRQANFIINNYQKTPFYNEIWPKINYIFEKEYEFLSEVVVETVLLERELFDIQTEIIFQSEIQYEKDLRKNDLLISLCKSIGADYYLSGNGAKKYMDVEVFTKNSIEVDFQQFTFPHYKQAFDFVPNLSALDVLFNCGLVGAKIVFAETVYEKV